MLEKYDVELVSIPAGEGVWQNFKLNIHKYINRRKRSIVLYTYGDTTYICSSSSSRDMSLHNGGIAEVPNTLSQD